MAASGTSAAAIIIALLHLAVADTGNGVSLKIMPSGDVQSKRIGSSFMLTCKAVGSDAITNIKWRNPMNRTIETLSGLKNSGVINPEMYVEEHSDKSLLWFTSLKESEGGRYTCSADFAGEQELVKYVTIESFYAIEWIDAPEDQYATLGKDYKIRCEVSARPSPTVDWFHGNEPINTKKNDNHTIIETHALKITNVTESDAGIYTCRASVPTTGEVKERTIRFEVYETPKIEKFTSDVKIIEGQSATITCNATGKPRPTYSWVKALTREDLSKADRFSVRNDTGVLTINNVIREDNGEYQCIAKNIAGEAQALIKVVVMGKPKIMEFVNETIAVRNNAEIECKAFGRPAPNVTFRKHTSLEPYIVGAQTSDPRIVLKSDSDYAIGETIATLSIQNVSRSDDGLYECIATNEVATAYKNGHLTVEFPPSFALMDNKTVWVGVNKRANLTCIAESIPNATIHWYYNNVDISKMPGSNRRYNQVGTAGISTLQIAVADRNTYGNYKCHAENKHGSGEYVIELKEAAKPGHLQNVKVKEITATTILFDLTPPPAQEGVPLRYISAQYRTMNPPQPWTDAKNKTWSVGSPAYGIDDLEPLTQYQFRFLASNDVGDGNWGNDVIETTPTISVPHPPTIQRNNPDNPYEVSQFSNQYEVHWLTPHHNGAAIEMYEIRYCQVKRDEQNWQVMDGTCRTTESKGQRTKKFLRDLNSESYYQIEVKARNNRGFSTPGVVYVRTARGDNSPSYHQEPLISSAAIICIVIAALFLIIVLIDVICCCTHKTGIIFYLCERSRKKPVDDEDTKLGSLYGWRFPLPYCDQKMANVAGVTAIQDSASGKNTIKLVKHTAIEEKEPLKEEKKITPIIDSGLRRETSITFDGKRSVSKTGFVGKDSAV